MLSADTKAPGGVNPGSKQYKDMKAAFDFFDKNHSGRINVSELGGVLKNIGRNPSEQEVKDMMSTVDQDSDGFLGFEEYVMIVGNQSRFQISAEEELKEQFRMFDLNGDGVVTKDELKKVMAGMGVIHRLLI